MRNLPYSPTRVADSPKLSSRDAFARQKELLDKELLREKKKEELRRKQQEHERLVQLEKRRQQQKKMLQQKREEIELKK